MGMFFLLLFIIFFVIPLLRVGYTVYTVRKKMRDAMRGMNEAQQQGARPEPRKGGWSAAEVRRKKIGRDVGEYVKFEELPALHGTDVKNRAGNVPGGSEPQVSDADWEDIK